jgi:phage baseplate assembly protein gpV
VALATNGRTKANVFAGALVSTTMSPTTTQEAKDLAAALATRLATTELSARGEVAGHPEIKAGSRVNITGMGTRLSGTYYITTVEHIFGRNTDLITRFTAGGTEPASIVDLLGGGVDRVSPFGRLGLTVGVVTNNKDPDEVGRVKVKFPTLSGEVESAWARVVSLGAGAATGFMIVPQIDDEVLVGFQDGDLRFPYVLGGLWSAKKKPPSTSADYLESSKVVQWGMTTKAGHSLQFVEGSSDDKSHFTVQLADKKTKLRLGKDKIEIVANSGKPIEIKNDKASIVLTSSGDIQIKGVNVTIEAQQALKATGSTGVEVKSNTTLKAEAGASLELKGSASAKIESSGITQIKGSMVTVN